MKRNAPDLVAVALERLLPSDFPEKHRFPVGWGGRFATGDENKDAESAVLLAFRSIRRDIAVEAFRNGTGQPLDCPTAVGSCISIPAERVDALRKASVSWFKSVRRAESKRRGDWGNWILETSQDPDSIHERVAELKANRERLSDWL